MKLLITGGCGFLGSNLAYEAINFGFELLVFDNLYRYGSKDNLAWLQNQGRFTFINGDIRNRADIARAIKLFKPDTIFHLAGQVAMTTSITNPQLDFEVNAIGTHNLLEATRNYAPEAIIVYSSTNKVYGSLSQYYYSELETRYHCAERPEGFDEKTQLEFHSPYGCSKGAADQYVLDYSRIYGMKTVVFRHSSMYGGRQFSTFDQGWIGWFCKMAVDIATGNLDKDFSISGTGKQVRDVLHVDDVKQLYFAVVDGIDAVTGEAFNIGGGVANSLSLIELFGHLESILGVKMRHTKNLPRESDQLIFIADLAKISKALGWRPSVTYQMGIKNTLDWLTSS